MRITMAERLLILTIALVPMAGCTICASPHDREYAAYGGMLPRADQCHGRVNSVFSDPGIATSVGDGEVIYESDSMYDSDYYPQDGSEMDYDSPVEEIDIAQIPSVDSSADWSTGIQLGDGESIVVDAYAGN